MRLKQVGGILVPAEEEAEPQHRRADDYRGACGKKYTPSPWGCYISIPVLHFLWGKPWDDFALRFVRAVNPSSIRATYGEETTDARIGCVTVLINPESDKILDIWQEVEVDGIGCGAELIAEYRKRYGDWP